MRNSKGNITVEFVFVFPWLLAAALGVMKVAVWMGKGALSHYLSFETARLKSLYYENLPRPLVPVQGVKALNGYTLRLEGKTHGDNPVAYCGAGGRYRQCRF